MRILVLGATGPAGICLVHEIQRVYPDATIVIYARSPQKLPSDISSSPSVTIIEGQLNDKAKLATIFDGGKIDAVLSALGPIFSNSNTRPITTAYAHIISLMQQRGVKRLLALSTISHYEPEDKPSLFRWFMVLLVRLFVRHAYNDVIAFTKLISESELDWTIVRVPRLVDNKGQRPVVGYIGDGKVGSVLSREAFAEFMVRELDSDEWLRKIPALSSC